MAARAVIHLNIADFAAQVECLKDSSLRGRPLIVAPQGSARSLTYDMSEEAFRSGVRKQMLLNRAARLCRRARILPPNRAHYQKAMTELLRLCGPYTPLVEAEESSGHLFLDLSGTGRLHGPPQDVAWRLRREIKAGLGFEPIWTLGANKLVAKVASRLVKPLGEYIVQPGEEAAFLGPLPLRLLPGIEDAEHAALAEFNLKEVQDALAWSSSQLRVLFGGRGPYLYQILRGHDNTPVLPRERRLSRLCFDHEFPEDSNDTRLVARILFGLCEQAGARLRGLGRAAKRVGVSLDYSDGMRAARGGWHQSGGTSNDFSLHALARAALDSAWQRRIRLRRLRLICDRLVLPPAQMDLFGSAEAKEQPQARLLQAMDQIRQRHGLGKIRLGRSLEASA